MNPYYVKCAICGRFCNPVDFADFIHVTYDGYDEGTDCFCQGCVDKLLKDYISGQKVHYHRGWQSNPNYVRVGKSILRHRRKLVKGGRDVRV